MLSRLGSADSRQSFGFWGRIELRLREQFCELAAFWSRNDAHWASSIGRIAVFGALLYALHHHRQGFQFFSTAGIEAWLAAQPADLWQPHGLTWLSSQPPGPAVVFIIQWAAWLSTAAALLGLWSRASFVVSALTVTYIVTLGVSWSTYWSHSWNFPCLAGLAFMFAKPGPLSLDALLPGRKPQTAPMWPVLLAQNSVALGLVAAAWAKIGFLYGRFTPDWIFSDNLRNAITAPYSMRGYEMPWWVATVVSHPALYIGAGLAHFAMQALPAAAFVSVSPRARFLEGCVFLLGSALLYLVMTLGNWSWFLLGALFVDWDHWISRRSAHQTLALGVLPKIYITSFLGVFAAVALVRHPFIYVAYPFSPMDFYSTVMDRVSIGERWKAGSFIHRGYHYWVGDVQVEGASGDTEDFRGLFNEAYSYALSSLDVKKSYVASVAHSITAPGASYFRYKDLLYPWAPWRYFPDTARPIRVAGPKMVEVWCSVYSIPPVPLPPLDRAIIYRGLVGAYDLGSSTPLIANGALQLGSNGGPSQVRVDTTGFDKRTIEILYVTDPRESDEPLVAQPLPGRWITPETFKLDRPAQAPSRKKGKMYYVVIRVKDQIRSRDFDFWGPPFALDPNGAF
jgi:hypothetical protein